MQFFVKPFLCLSSLLGLLAVTTVALPTNETGLTTGNNETGLYNDMNGVSEIVAAMEKHDKGIIHLGDDGVLRSLAPNMTVLGYVQLTTGQIQRMLDSHGRNDHLTEVFDGISGHDVPGEQLNNPGKHLWPRGFPREEDTLPQTLQNRQSGIIGPPAISVTQPNCPRDYCTNNEECFQKSERCGGCTYKDAEVDPGLCFVLT